MSAETDLIRSFGTVCTMLATPSKLPPKKLKAAQSLARRIGDLAAYYADHSAVQANGTGGMAGSMLAEMSVLIKALSEGNKPPRKRGRPPKSGKNFYVGLFVLPVYASFKGSRANAVRYLIKLGLVTLGKNEPIETRVKKLDRLSASIDKK